ncbi:integrase arm-type DNA-binding domain-containing protein [bacterium]|nr:integrase arm-type DNA-binding domain-containing protein [bacterium]
MAHQFYFNSYILDNLPSPDSGFDVVQDISEPRLRMYVTSRGVKTFFVRKRVGGRDRRIIIGNYPDMDIEDARSAVADVLSRAMEKPKARRRKISFAKLTELYLANRVRRSEDGMVKLRRAIALHLAPLADKNVTDITSADVVSIIDSISGAAIARRMQELIQSIFKYGMETGYVTANPMRGMKKVELRRRPRVLTRGGVRNLIAAIDENAPSAVLRAAFLMLIYGFAPKSRVFTMQWSDLDFNQYMWGMRPLSDAAVVLLQDLPQDGNWVFSVRGRMCLADPRTAWRRVVSAAGMPNLTMDDVHKFMMRNLTWASSAEDLRTNMNTLIEEIME